MEAVPAGEGGPERGGQLVYPRYREQYGRLWSAWYIPDAELARVYPRCVIDLVTYSDERVTLRLPNGSREFGTRDLWPDESKVRDFRTFYAQLEASIAKDGIKVPILLWKIGSRFYVRYGASRLYVARKLGITHGPVIVCSWDDDILPGQELGSPVEILQTMKVARVKQFEASHERLDMHRMDPVEFYGLA